MHFFFIHDLIFLFLYTVLQRIVTFPQVVTGYLCVCKTLLKAVEILKEKQKIIYSVCIF